MNVDFCFETAYLWRIPVGS